MYKSAFLGCGPRARGHAHAYKYVEKGKIEALCDLNQERLNAFGEEFKVEKRYTDIHEMLDKEHPDVLHIVTPPTLRYDLMKIADDHHVPVVIIEKPIALQGEDWRQIKELQEKADTKYVVNTQLHFHAPNLELKQNVAEGLIGDVRFIDVSARSTILDQGVHVLELAHSYINFAAPVRVFGNVSGGKTLNSRQPSPDIGEAAIEFENGVRAQLVCGDVAPKAADNDSRYAHKRISVYGDRGFIQWTMHGWERNTPDKGYESGSHSYGEQDVLAQARLTDAAFDWAADEGKPHPTRLERSLAQFNIILGAYISALYNVSVDLPFDPPNGILDAFKYRLKE
jgi:predicted dehydrogenase